MNWTSDKPVFTEDCVLVTMNERGKIKFHSLYLIEWSKKRKRWLLLHASSHIEIGDINDLKADKYLILPKHE